MRTICLCEFFFFFFFFFKRARVLASTQINCGFVFVVCLSRTIFGKKKS